jgi:hypothetical protein
MHMTLGLNCCINEDHRMRVSDGFRTGKIVCRAISYPNLIVVVISGHLLGPGQVRPDQGKAQNSGPDPARPDCRAWKCQPRLGLSELFLVRPPGFWARPSQNYPKLLPKPGLSKQSGHVSAAQSQDFWAGLGWSGYPCPGLTCSITQVWWSFIK